MDRGAGFVCIVFHKETKVYKIDSSDDVERQFEELGVGDSTELVNSYWVLNHYSFANFCQKEFADKRIPKSEYFQLTNEDLEKLKRILEEDELKSRQLIREESDAEWIKNLKSTRREYSQKSNYKKFTTRHQNVIAAGLMIPIGLLIALPLFGIAVLFLEAIGLNQYYLIVPTFVFYFWVLWTNEKNDKDFRDKLFKNEDLLIKEHIETWKSIYKAEDEYEKRKGK